MDSIEQKALALVNEVLAEWGVLKNAVEVPKNSDAFARALLRAIEQHEAFRQEVSDAVEYLKALYPTMPTSYDRFIIAKPDPLVEVLEEASGTNDPVEWANRFYAAIEKRGGKLTWGEG